jgi:hypothetical protein
LQPLLSEQSVSHVVSFVQNKDSPIKRRKRVFLSSLRPGAATATAGASGDCAAGCTRFQTLERSTGSFPDVGKGKVEWALRARFIKRARRSRSTCVNGKVGWKRAVNHPEIQPQKSAEGAENLFVLRFL